MDRAWITSLVFTPSHVLIKQTSQMALNTDEQAPNECESGGKTFIETRENI